MGNYLCFPYFFGYDSQCTSPYKLGLNDPVLKADLTDIDIIECSAGSIHDDVDEMKLVYFDRILNLQEVSKGLYGAWRMIKKAYGEGESLVPPVMRMLVFIEAVRNEYLKFFRDSLWHVDDYVQERKDVALPGYYMLEDLEQVVKDILIVDEIPSLHKIIRRCDKILSNTMDIFDHHQRTSELVKPKPRREDYEDLLIPFLL